MGLPGQRANRSIGWCAEREPELPAPLLAFAKLEARDGEIVNFHDQENTWEINTPSKLDAIGASSVSLGHLRGFSPKNKSFNQATGNGRGLCAPVCSIRGRTGRRGPGCGGEPGAPTCGPESQMEGFVESLGFSTWPCWEATERAPQRGSGAGQDKEAELQHPPRGIHSDGTGPTTYGAHRSAQMGGRGRQTRLVYKGLRRGQSPGNPAQRSLCRVLGTFQAPAT